MNRRERKELIRQYKKEWKTKYGPLRMAASSLKFTMVQPYTDILHEKKTEIGYAQLLENPVKHMVTFPKDQIEEKTSIHTARLQALPGFKEHFELIQNISSTEEIKMFTDHQTEAVCSGDVGMFWFYRALSRFHEIGIRGFSPSYEQFLLMKETELNFKAEDLMLPANPFVIVPPKQVLDGYRRTHEVSVKYIIVHKIDGCIVMQTVSPTAIWMMTDCGIDIPCSKDQLWQNCDAFQIYSPTDSLEERFNDSVLPSLVPTQGPLNDKEKDVVWTLCRVAFNCIMAMSSLGHREIAEERRKGVPMPSSAIKSKDSQWISEINLDSKIYSAIESEGTGIIKKPHWRRGHWRNQKHGAGMEETKVIFIKPTFIHKEALEGSQVASGTNYSK